MWLKLRELWDECEKMPKDVFAAFVEGLHEIVDKGQKKQNAKPCVAENRAGDNARWTEAEEDLLHRCCQDVSIARGVKLFLEKTGSKRTPGACKLRTSVMKRGKRW